MPRVHERVKNGRTAAEPDAARTAARVGRLYGKLFFLIPLGVIGNILFTLASSDRAALQSIAHFAPGFFAIAMLLSVVPWFTGSLRLFIWSRFLGEKLRYRDTFTISIGAELGAAVSPPMIGGGPVKIGMLMQKGFTGGAALSLIVLENFEDAFFFLIMVPLALTLSSAWDLPVVRSVIEALRHPSFLLVLAGVGAFIAGLIPLRRRAEGILKRLPFFRTLAFQCLSSFHHFIKTYRIIIRSGKSVFALTITLTAVQWICRYSIISLLLLSLGIPARPMLYMALQVVVFGLIAFVPTPGGAGGAEALFSVIYRSFLPADTIGVITAGWRFLTFYLLLFVAAVLFLFFGIQPLTVPVFKESAPWFCPGRR